jgi:putative endonuclease
MWHVYALKSTSRNYIYVGIASDVVRRVAQHNSGHERTTRPYRPFVVIYTEPFLDRPAARAKEKWLKSGIGKEYLKALQSDVLQYQV